LLKQKVAKNVAISLGYFILSKNETELSKVSQIGQKLPILVTLEKSNRDIEQGQNILARRKMK
jgi:hypothetical protein